MRLRARAVSSCLITLAAAATLGSTLVAPASAVTTAPSTGAPALRTASASAAVGAEDRASRAAARAALMRAAAVRLGKSKVGHAQYVAGGSGPHSFDCSGFTSWVWRRSGKAIPRSSYGQYSGLKKISRSQARPGDLVFFFGLGSHHVGLYIGGGKMVHAANPERDVLISNIDGPWYRERLSGFRRVV